MPILFLAVRRCRNLTILAGIYLLLWTFGASSLCGSDRYPYRTVPGDSLHTRIYRLK
ncbi:MAG: hypothetical protein HGA70_09850, partial [Chlorobiaceae bacterium]|nr:hypothetical protein [Chlorobiaceae bacterium]